MLKKFIVQKNGKVIEWEPKIPFEFYEDEIQDEFEVCFAENKTLAKAQVQMMQIIETLLETMPEEKVKRVCLSLGIQWEK